MEETFELDKTNARELTLEGWRTRPTYDKALQWGIAPLRLQGRSAVDGRVTGESPWLPVSWPLRARAR